MKLEFIPILNQKFEVGRTINPFKCDCDNCDFMHCPKNNYAVKMKRKRHTVEKFFEDNREEILKLNKPKRWMRSFHDEFKMQLTYNLINELADYLCYKFPTNTYWNVNDCTGEDIEKCVYDRIDLVKISRGGKEITLGYVKICDGSVHDIDFNESRYKLASRISNAFIKLKNLIYEYYENEDRTQCHEDWKIGWISPEGRHYPCSYGEHFEVANHLDTYCGEFELERNGWVKVASDDVDGYFGNRYMMSAEQKNWLSMHGYVLEE